LQFEPGYGVRQCLAAVESIGANALVLHLNPLQEAVQPGGDTDYRDLSAKIAALCRELPYPVIAKEGGWGLSREAALRLRDAGVAALDVAGAGGTSWSRVERYRAATPAAARVAAAFDDWGLPTVDTLAQVRAACPDLPIIASGGLTDGVEVAKGLALGASLGGMARPLLRPAVDSLEAAVEAHGVVVDQLRIAMFGAGACPVAALPPDRLFLRSRPERHE
jgi:isopentenyl-diphosphate delta-isomerase